MWLKHVAVCQTKELFDLHFKSDLFCGKMFTNVNLMLIVSVSERMRWEWERQKLIEWNLIRFSLRWAKCYQKNSIFFKSFRSKWALFSDQKSQFTNDLLFFSSFIFSTNGVQLEIKGWLIGDVIPVEVSKEVSYIYRILKQS